MQEGYVVAAGLDHHLRIFDLRKSEPLFVFKLPDGIVKFKFLTAHHFMMHLKNGECQVARMFFPAKIMLRSNQMVQQVGRVHGKPGGEQYCDPTLVYTMFADQSIQF